MKIIVIIIEDCGYSPNAFTVSQGEKKVGERVLKKRIFLFVQQILHIQDERRRPARIVSINAPWQHYKCAQISFGLNRDNLYLGQCLPLLFAVR